MKSLLFVCSMILLDAVGPCGTRGNNHDYNYLKVTPVEVYIGPREVKAEITVFSDTRWSVTADRDWIDVNPTSGSGDATIVVTALSSFPHNRRTCTLTISGEEETRQVKVYQIGEYAVDD